MNYYLTQTADKISMRRLFPNYVYIISHSKNLLQVRKELLFFGLASFSLFESDEQSDWYGYWDR